MKKSLWFSLLTFLILIPGTLFLGTQLTGRWYYLVSTLVLLETMLPFFFAFETRKPEARELVLIAVLSALAVAARVAIVIPHFKPMTAVIMLAGVALGAEAGFVTGAMAAFASNFLLSQGPWTPWQMMAFGAAGFLAGLCFHRGQKRSPAVLAAFGAGATLLIVGPLLDVCTFFTTGGEPSWAYAATVFSAGFLINLKHAAATGVTLLLLTKPLLEKLDRVILKYGIMDVRKE